jgi:competence protein ComEC
MDDATRRRLAESPGEQSIVRFLAHRRIRRVDLVVLSHPHPDHYLGLGAVARAVDIGEVWIARQHVEQPLDLAFHALMIQLALGGTRIVTPPLGEARNQAGATLTVLWPEYFDDETAAVDPVSSVNDNSLVVRLDFAGRRVLFAGDVETEAEEMLAERYRGGQLRADVVKVPHHGSRTSSTPPFVAATAPRYAVISCGVANRFSFPAPEVVERWLAAGAQVWRTDQVGAVTLDIARDGKLRIRGHDAP